MRLIQHRCKVVQKVQPAIRITQYDEGLVNPFSEELNLEPKVEVEEDLEEELDDGIDM